MNSHLYLILRYTGDILLSAAKEVEAKIFVWRYFGSPWIDRMSISIHQNFGFSNRSGALFVGAGRSWTIIEEVLFFPQIL